MIIEKYKDTREALRALTEELRKLMEEKKEARRFNLALSGGETAKLMFSLWTEEYKEVIDWNMIHFFWVDERCVPPSDPESNYGNAERMLFFPLNIPMDHIHRIRGEEEPGTEAVRYSWEVKENLPRFDQLPIFDCIILGVGTDFHTASIFPANMKLLYDSKSYTVSQQPESGQYCVTMTGQLILNSAPLFVPIVGKGKERVINELREGFLTKQETPATYILSHATKAMVFVE